LISGGQGNTFNYVLGVGEKSINKCGATKRTGFRKNRFEMRGPPLNNGKNKEPKRQKLSRGGTVTNHVKTGKAGHNRLPPMPGANNTGSASER